MTDRELMQQWMRPGAIVPVDMNTVRILLDALRELAQPQRTHWEGCEEVHPECQKPGCAECGKSGGWALYCVECMGKMARDDDDTQVYRSELEAAVKAEREPLLEALTAICVKCRSNEWGPTTPRKEILNWMHDHASAAIIRARGETK